jgi:hypothetical protein
MPRKSEVVFTKPVYGIFIFEEESFLFNHESNGEFHASAKLAFLISDDNSGDNRVYEIFTSRGCAFPLHNPGNYSPICGVVKGVALRSPAGAVPPRRGAPVLPRAPDP